MKNERIPNFGIVLDQMLHTNELIMSINLFVIVITSSVFRPSFSPTLDAIESSSDDPFVIVQLFCHSSVGTWMGSIQDLDDSINYHGREKRRTSSLISTSRYIVCINCLCCVYNRYEGKIVVDIIIIIKEKTERKTRERERERVR